MGGLRERRWQRRVRLGAMGLMVLVGLLVSALTAGRDDTYIWLLAIGMVLVVMGVVWFVIDRSREHGSSMFPRSPLWDVERPERKEVMRAIRRGTDVRPELHDVAARTAHQLARMKRFLWFYVALAVFSIANGIFLQDGLLRWLELAVGVLFLVAGGSFAWQAKSARAAEQRFAR